MGYSKIKAAKRVRFQTIIDGIVCVFVASWFTGFGVFIEYCAVRVGIKGESVGDVAVFVLIGLGIILLSILLWKAAISEWKKARELKQYISEHEGEADEPEKNAKKDRGQLTGRGLSALAMGIFVMVWIIDALEHGVPIWFASMGMLLVIFAGSQAISDLTDAAQLGRKELENLEENTTGEISSGNKRSLVGLILLGVLAVYDSISFGVAFSRNISEKALPLVLLGNGVIILSVILEKRYEIKALFKRKSEKSDEANEKP